MSDHRHVTPVNDLIEHEDNEDCVCGPTSELVKRDDGSDAGWLHVHHSLDGREATEHHAASPQGWGDTPKRSS